MSHEKAQQAKKKLRFGVRREAKRHAAFPQTSNVPKAVSPLRSATAVQNGSRDGAVTDLKVLRTGLRITPKLESDSLAVEEPLEIRVQGRSVAVTMRTPGHDKELAAGFLLTEGIIRGQDDLIEILNCRAADAPNNTVNAFLSPSVKLDFAQLTRHVFATSSCGLCGKASIASVHQHFPPVKSRATVEVKTLTRLPALMREAQQTFAQTGGLHAAAVFDANGKLIVLREDVGRHNAVDKVLGYGLLEDKLPFDAHILLVSGRASFEIMQKALAARIPIVCAVSAPSSLAVDFARESGQMLVGFLRGQTMNIYSKPNRIRN